jgi:hypothetical protein
LTGKAGGKKQQRQPQKGASGGDAAAIQSSAGQPAAALPASEVAYSADKAKDATGVAPVTVGLGEGSVQQDAATGTGANGSAAAGSLLGGEPVAQALKSGFSRLQVQGLPVQNCGRCSMLISYAELRPLLDADGEHNATLLLMLLL